MIIKPYNRMICCQTGKDCGFPCFGKCCNNQIQKWQHILNLDDWTITNEKILPEQVLYDDDVPEEDRFFIGIEKNHNTKEANLIHDRDLYDEAVLHELLHIKYPDKDEDWINNKTEEWKH